MMISQLLFFICFNFSRSSNGGGGFGGALSFILTPLTLTPTPRATARTSPSSTATALQQQLSKGGMDLPPEVYPLSRKKILLIEEAKRLNACYVSSNSKSSSPSNTRDVAASSSSSYSPAGWSNRLGSILTPVSIPGVYTADRPFYWNKIDVGCRMTVVQLTQPTSTSQEPPQLLIHSPVHLDPPLIEALSKLGTVSHIVSPNYEHVKYAQEWAEYYPHAKVWGCPGLCEKMPNVRWTGELMEGTRPPRFHHGDEGNAPLVGYIDGMWNWDEVQPMHINTEKNPFTGRPFFNEVVFYHAVSKTLIVTDLYWNYPRGDGVTNGDLAEKREDGAADASANDEEDEDFGVWELAPNVGNIPLGSKVWGKIGMDRLFYPFYMNVMVTPEKRQTFEEIARYITCGSGWEVETIIPAHGDIVRGKKFCRKVLETFFRIKCRTS